MRRRERVVVGFLLCWLWSVVVGIPAMVIGTIAEATTDDTMILAVAYVGTSVILVALTAKFVKRLYTDLVEFRPGV